LPQAYHAACDAFFEDDDYVLLSALRLWPSSMRFFDAFDWTKPMHVDNRFAAQRFVPRGTPQAALPSVPRSIDAITIRYRGRACSCRLSGSATVGRLHPCQLNQYGERVGDGGSVAAAPRWIGGVVSAWRKLMYGPDDLRKQVDPTDHSVSERTSNAAEQRLAVVLGSTL
jgi:hypothetical protein